jgi:rhodanese-related sulfurtransferase
MPGAVREIDPSGLAAAARDGAVIVDVREAHEYVDGHVPCARLVPLRTVGRRAGELRHEAQGTQPVYLICRTGVRSADAAHMLGKEGVDAVSVAGGTEAWKAAGLPVVTGSHAC